jgi:hypothetical protein
LGADAVITVVFPVEAASAPGLLGLRERGLKVRTVLWTLASAVWCTGCRKSGLRGRGTTTVCCREVFRLSISELDGARSGGEAPPAGIAAHAFLRLWLDDDVRIELRDTVEEPLEDVELLDERRP